MHTHLLPHVPPSWQRSVIYVKQWGGHRGGCLRIPHLARGIRSLSCPCVTAARHLHCTYTPSRCSVYTLGGQKHDTGESRDPHDRKHEKAASAERTLALNLAIARSSEGRNVLLIDADAQRSALTFTKVRTEQLGDSLGIPPSRSEWPRAHDRSEAPRTQLRRRADRLRRPRHRESLRAADGLGYAPHSHAAS